MLYVGHVSICVLWRSGAEEHGPLAIRVFAPRIFFTAIETTPRKTADAFVYFFGVKALMRCCACCVSSCDDYLFTQERQHASTALGSWTAKKNAEMCLKQPDVHSAYAFRKLTLSGPVWRWWHATRTVMVETRRKKLHVAALSHI